jgi:hypothetical protein
MGRVVARALSVILLCLGIAVFLVDNALGPPMVAAAIATWLVM